MQLPVYFTRSRLDDAVYIYAREEIDFDNAHLLRDAVTSALSTEAAERIIIDLGAVSMIDSVGVGILVSCYHAAAACHVPLAVVNPAPLVHRQLWICGLAGLFGLSTSRPRHEPGATQRACAAGDASATESPDPGSGRSGWVNVVRVIR